MPMRGTQPVLMFSNQKVLQENGISAPKTWDEPAERRADAQGQGHHADRPRWRRPVADPHVVRVRLRPGRRPRPVQEGAGR
nr:hypothetical protein [Angustibacter aerolatus]